MCIHTLSYITQGLWKVTEHKGTDFDLPGWQTGQPNKEDTTVTYTSTQNTQMSTAAAVPSSLSITCNRSGRKRCDRSGMTASSVSTPIACLQHQDGGLGELEDDLRSQQGAERPREDKGGQGAAAHRILWKSSRLKLICRASSAIMCSSSATAQTAVRVQKGGVQCHSHSERTWPARLA